MATMETRPNTQMIIINGIVSLSSISLSPHTLKPTLNLIIFTTRFCLHVFGSNPRDGVFFSRTFPNKDICAHTIVDTQHVFALHVHTTTSPPNMFTRLINSMTMSMQTHTHNKYRAHLSLRFFLGKVNVETHKSTYTPLNAETMYVLHYG